MGSMKHVDMRKLPAAAQDERRRQVIGLRQAGMTYEAIAAQVGLGATGCSTSASATPSGARPG
jgi:transposase